MLIDCEMTLLLYQGFLLIFLLDAHRRCTPQKVDWFLVLYFRFELDMLIESVTVTVKRVEELLDRLNDNTSTDNAVHIEDFTGQNLISYP